MSARRTNQVTVSVEPVSFLCRCIVSVFMCFVCFCFVFILLFFVYVCVCCPIEPFFGGVSSVRGVSVKLGSEEFYVYEYSSFALPCRWKVAFIVFFLRILLGLS